MSDEQRLLNEFYSQIHRYLQAHTGPGANEISEITTHIFISNFANSLDINKLKDYDIEGILYLGAEDKKPHAHSNYKKENIEHYFIQIEDESQANFMMHLENCYNYIHAFLSDEKSILVHCGEGISRASTAVIYYLLKRYYLTNLKRGATGSHARKNKDLVAADVSYVLDIIKFIKNSRPCISPNPGFVQQLLIMERRMKQDLRDLMKSSPPKNKKSKKSRNRQDNIVIPVCDASQTSESDDDLFDEQPVEQTKKSTKSTKSTKSAKSAKSAKSKSKKSTKSVKSKKSKKSKSKKSKKSKSNVKIANSDNLDDLSDLESLDASD